MKYTDPDGEFVVVAVAIGAGALAYLLLSPDVAQAPRFEGDYVKPTTGEKVIQQTFAVLGAAGAMSCARALLNSGSRVATAEASGSANELSTSSKLAEAPKPQPTTEAFEIHHELPKQFKKQFQRAGLDIEKYTKKISRAKHRLKSGNGLHTGSPSWNAKWKEFFKNNPRATKAQILKQLRKMRAESGT